MHTNVSGFIIIFVVVKFKVEFFILIRGLIDFEVFTAASRIKVFGVKALHQLHILQMGVSVKLEPDDMLKPLDQCPETNGPLVGAVTFRRWDMPHEKRNLPFLLHFEKFVF